MNTDHLKYLIAIGKTKSMSQASESLFITPQALSVAIKKLEEELGLPLLIRSSSGTELTENGQWLVDLSSHFFDNIAFRQEQYRLYLGAVPEIHSGTLNLLINSTGINESQLGDIICDITQHEPGLSINLKEAMREDVEKAVLSGAIEMGFIYRTKFNKKFIDELEEPLVFYPLQKGCLTILAHDKYPFAKFESTYLKKIVDYPICSYEAIESGNRAPDFLKLVTNKSVNYTRYNNYSLYRSNIMQGNSIAVTVQMENDKHPFNYVEGVNIVNVRDDIQVYFGTLRRKEELSSNNANYFWHKLLKVYHPQKINK